ncbi:MAG TPA: tripartite tricarboxylate transporter substrate binding protein [Burkholderiales bacterium]|nr:tripartite tricarboxylate transporter substrate binding protein [Burkholderiales bacterium]
MRVAVTALLVATILIGTPPASAQWKPDKPVEIVAPSGPGGTTDRTARVIARVIQQYKFVDVPVNVVNKPGGSGTIGYTYLNQHPGDGHYIIIGTSGSVSNFITGTVPFNHNDFTSVAMLFDEWMSINVQAGSPMKSGRDLIARLKQNPEGLPFGISTSRSGGNFTSLMICLRGGGIDIKRVKTVIFQGGGATTQALLGGHVEVINTGPGNMVEFLRAGKLRTLAVSGPTRLWGPFADVPTWREQGVPADAGSWRGIQGPKGMSAAQLSFWDRLFQKLVQTEEWKKDLEANFWVDTYAPAAEARRAFDREFQEFKAILTELGMAKSN